MKDKIIIYAVFVLLASSVVLLVVAAVSFVISFFIASAASISTGCIEWAALTFMCQFILFNMHRIGAL